jgi:hypothetical protein
MRCSQNRWREKCEHEPEFLGGGRRGFRRIIARSNYFAGKNDFPV